MYIMKGNLLKKAFLLIVFVLAGLCVNAQTLEEVVYLKNGGIIRGIIIEQVPNESLKIQTKDGNVFVYQIEEIEKITKEAPVNTYQSYNYASRESIYNFNDEDDEYGWNTGLRYRGFIADSFILGLGDYAENREFVWTSHGVQINPFLYVGAGLGANYWLDSQTWALPIFAHIRTELHKVFKKNVSPYFDVKGGYSVVNVTGGYFSPEIGCHFYFGHSKCGLSVGVNYTLQSAEVSSYYYGGRYGYYYYSREILSGLGFTLAFDF